MNVTLYTIRCTYGQVIQEIGVSHEFFVDDVPTAWYWPYRQETYAFVLAEFVWTVCPYIKIKDITTVIDISCCSIEGKNIAFCVGDNIRMIF